MLKLNLPTLCLIGFGYYFFVAKPDSRKNEQLEAGAKAAGKVINQVVGQAKKVLDK